MSGLIFVALALVWAVVLLPKALRHHDELAQTRSVDDISESARVIARREVVSERQARLVVGAHPASAAAPGPAPAREPTGDRVRAQSAARRRAAAAAARRRRRILGALLVAGLAVAVLVATGQLPLWSLTIPVVLVVGFLGAARVTVRRERVRAERSLRALHAGTPASTPTMSADESAPLPVTSQPAPSAEREPAEVHNEQGLAVVSGLDDTSSFPVGLLDPATATAAGALWDPLPVTLPTYVTKPRAQRSVRTIDLQSPGVVSSGHDAAASALVADAATSPPPDELPQRAVGS